MQSDEAARLPQITRPGESRDPPRNGYAAFVYILASKPLGALYVASTADLIRRVREHKMKAIPGFTAKYCVDRLVWFEGQERLAAAAKRERQVKEWKRPWKVQLIERDNPQWIDLYPSLTP